MIKFLIFKEVIDNHDRFNFPLSMTRLEVLSCHSLDLVTNQTQIASCVKAGRLGPGFHGSSLELTLQTVEIYGNVTGAIWTKQHPKAAPWKVGTIGSDLY